MTIAKTVWKTATVGSAVAAVVAAAPAAWGATPAGPPPSGAPSVVQDAGGCQPFGGFNYTFKGVTVKVPAAAVCHKVLGSGRSVVRTEARVAEDGLIGRYCNWRFDWMYYDTNNTLYSTSRGNTHTSCNNWTSVSRIDETNRTLRYGLACAGFYVNGVLRAKQCHNITS